jgi:hypothetical protein
VKTPDPARHVNLFTGFDPQDDFPLADLRTIGGPAAYPGPLLLVNCALNCLAGDELAYQDRRADAFVMTPDQCGGRLTGYAATPDKDPHADNLTLGRVLTISGAAVDPNMSGLTAPMTALMTIFNTRLGWWLQNPARGKPWHAEEPNSGWPLLDELAGMTNETSKYVHLSDGGHFENLGVYELIRRRCRYVIVVDAGIDETAASDNMAAMLMLVRTDFGIRIELDPSLMQRKDATGFSQWHCAVGRIRYDEVDQAAVPGVLIYVQAALTGDEPADLLQYLTRNPDFPRQSTLNQFFDEVQFECYRALGHHAATQVFGQAAAAWSGQALNPSEYRAETRAVFASLRDQWFPPPACSEAQEISTANATLQLDQQCIGNPNLISFNSSLYPEIAALIAMPPRPLTHSELQEFGAVSQTLQIMELAWSTMKLDDYRAHPINRGWMNTFRRWTTCKAFHDYWPFLRAEFSKPFVRFCENALNLVPTRVKSIREHELVNMLHPLNAIDLVGKLEQQFGYEWGDTLQRLNLPAAFVTSNMIADIRSKARTEDSTADSSGQPFIWYLFQEGILEHCCGIVCLAANPGRLRLLQPSVNIDEEAEFFLWVSGPYRALNIGTDAVQSILDKIAADSAYEKWPLKRLTVFHPLQSAASGGRLELERWMNFFFDQGFRRIKQPDTGVGAKFAVLKRELSA